MRKLDNTGVSEAFGTIFMIMIFLALIGALTSIGAGYMQDLQETADELIPTPEYINQTINNAIFNAVNQTLATIEYTNSTIIITIPNAQNQTLKQYIK
jgi:hypothetical protein